MPIILTSTPAGGFTFLQLTQKLRQKTGGNGTGPTTVITQTGEAKDYVDWVSEAWLLIQAEEPNWKWMKKEFSFVTTAGKRSYLPTAATGETGITDLSMWCTEDSWRCYRTATGRTDEAYLVEWDYQTFRDTYDFGLASTLQSKPSVYAIRDSDLAVILGQTPDSIYTVTGQYQGAPIPMVADADVPGLPSRFHMAIVYRAMILYARFEAAPEVEADGQKEYDKLMAALRIDQLDTLSLGAPLA